MPIALIGSCITRDMWMFEKVPLPPRFTFFARTSLATLFSHPVDLPRDRLESDWQERMLTAEMKKTAIPVIENARPEVLLIDFIDERFDLVASGHSYLNNSQELLWSHLVEKNSDAVHLVPRLSDTTLFLWKNGAQRLAALLDGPDLAGTKVFLHAGRWATHYRGDDGLKAFPDQIKVLADNYGRISDHNALLDTYEQYLSTLTGRITFIRVPEELRLGDQKHPWGLQPFHYIPEYYHEIHRQLGEHGVDITATDGRAKSLQDAQ